MIFQRKSIVTKCLIRKNLLRLAATLALLTGTPSVLAQSQEDRDRGTSQAKQMIRRSEIPEATLPATPAETKWWEDLRAAAKNVQHARTGNNEREIFRARIKEGIQKAYQVPIADRGVTVLWRAEPAYTPEAIVKSVRGKVALMAELKSDGTVGEVKIVQGLDAGLDQTAAEAAKRLIFLPAVKNRKFISFFMPMTMFFDIH